MDAASLLNLVISRHHRLISQGAVPLLTCWCTTHIVEVMSHPFFFGGGSLPWLYPAYHPKCTPNLALSHGSTFDPGYKDVSTIHPISPLVTKHDAKEIQFKGTIPSQTCIYTAFSIAKSDDYPMIFHLYYMPS